MKAAIEQKNIYNNKNGYLTVILEGETLSDDSKAYNVVLALYDVNQPKTTYIENHESVSVEEATKKYQALVDALDGFELWS